MYVYLYYCTLLVVHDPAYCKLVTLKGFRGQDQRLQNVPPVLPSVHLYIDLVCYFFNFSLHSLFCPMLLRLGFCLCFPAFFSIPCFPVSIDCFVALNDCFQFSIVSMDPHCWLVHHLDLTHQKSLLQRHNNNNNNNNNNKQHKI